MHDTALQIGRLAFATYCQGKKPSVLELGAQDINGSLRAAAPLGARYVGVDIAEGPGVDVVVKPGQALPFADNSFDFAIASSVFEHDPVFWETFLQICRKVKPGGYVYMNAPSNGAVHRYPEDHWRFYPDSSKALARWAVSQGVAVELVESFTAARVADIWNDFVAVFRKLPARRKLPAKLLYEQVSGSANIQVGAADSFLNPAHDTQDMVLIAEARGVAATAQERIAGLERALEDLRTLVRQRDHKLADIESTLRQRQEEIEQTERARAQAYSEVGDLQVALAASRADSAILSEKLAESEGWTFRLAGERAAAEAATKRAQFDLNKTKRKLAAAESRALALKQDLVVRLRMLDEARAAHYRTEADVAAMAVELADRERELDALRVAADQARLELIGERDRAHSAELRTEQVKLELRTAQAEIGEAEMQMSQRFVEIARLSEMLREKDLNERRKRTGLEITQRVFALIDGAPWWWRFMPRRWQQASLVRDLARRGLFDAGAYLARNPDVAADGMDPIRHFVLHGLAEQREF